MRKGGLLGFASAAPHPAYISSVKFDYLSTNLTQASRVLEREIAYTGIIPPQIHNIAIVINDWLCCVF